MDTHGHTDTEDPETPTKSKQEKKKSRRKKKKRKSQELDIISKLPGVRKLILSELTQKIINCVVGEHVTMEKPWTVVKKELVQDNLELHEESSEFLPIRNEILEFPGTEMIIGYKPDDTNDTDEFFICTTEEATTEVAKIIEHLRKTQEERLYNSINKTIRPWTNLGSDAIVDEAIEKRNRPLIEVEIESKYPILPFKIQFRIRNVEHAKDGYMELLTTDEVIATIAKRRIDAYVQVSPSVINNEVQTRSRYPSNAATQYEYLVKINSELWKDIAPFVQNYFESMEHVFIDLLKVNRSINLYTDDYEDLSSKIENLETNLAAPIEYMTFNDVIMCKGKMVSSVCWHEMITGLVAISYSDVAPNIYIRKSNKPNEDEVYRAVHGTNPVLIWSFLDPLNAKLILESPREVTAISFCPFDENLVIGGTINGQIILWDIKNKIRRVEEREILTNSQQKYRSYMRTLMGWMKNIKDLKRVRTTAVSNIRYSHNGAVINIQWISPFEEVSKTGKGVIKNDPDATSLQFLTAGEDGAVLLWDLLKKPTVEPGGYRERKLKRLKKKPAALTQDVSPFQALHLNLKPIYQLLLNHPKTNHLIGISAIAYRKLEIDYGSSNKRQSSMTERVYFNATPKASSETEFGHCFHIGTMEGQYIDAYWEGRDFDLGEIVNSENIKINQISKFHDGPVHIVEQNPEADAFLTVGGKIFAVWTRRLKNHPIFWRKCKSFFTKGGWSTINPCYLRLLRNDGIFESWHLTSNSKNPLILVQMASVPLTTLEIHPRPLPHNVFGVADTYGSFRVFKVTVGQQLNDQENIASFIDREVKHKHVFITWQNDWNKRYTEELEKLEVKEVKEENPLLVEVEEKEKKEGGKPKEASKETKGKPPPGRYLEWVKEKQLAKEQDRIKTMILKKKSLDTEALQKQRQPILVLEAENEIRKKKQRARIKGSENIFKETVAMLFPAIVREKPPPSADPYAGGDPVEDKEYCFQEFQTLARKCENYLDQNPYQIDFNWKEVLFNARRRRRFLDNSFKHATHMDRHKHYKDNRAAGVSTVGLSRLKESVAPSEVDRAPSIKQRVQNYPFATVLRLRVLQIVCGISFLIIGTVAFIEEQGKMNLGLGIPAGGATIIAAAASIHTTKGFSGYRTSTCVPGSFLRFLGPTIRIAIPLTLLWTTSCSVIGAIIVQSTRIIGCFSRKTCDNMEAENIKDLMVLSVIELSLSLVTLSAVFVLFRIDCKYDPD